MKKIFPLLAASCLYFAATAQNVIQIEYFIDTDAGFGSNTLISVPPAADSNFSFTANLTGTSVGYHKLYIRTKDSDGKWSLTSRRNVEVLSNGGAVYVSGVEYFFGDDPGVGKASFITFGTPLTDGSFDFIVPANQIPTGVDTLFIRVKDSTNKNWSLTATKIKYYITSSCPQGIWLGAVSTNWHNPVNWSCNVVPDANTEVIIVSLTTYSCEVLTGNAAVCKKIMTVPGGNVKVNTGATLTVSGN